MCHCAQSTFSYDLRFSLTFLAGDVRSYKETSKGNKRITIITHNQPTASSPPFVSWSSNLSIDKYDTNPFQLQYYSNLIKNSKKTDGFHIFIFVNGCMWIFLFYFFWLDRGIVIFWIEGVCACERVCLFLSWLKTCVSVLLKVSMAQYVVYLTSCHSEGFSAHISVQSSQLQGFYTTCACSAGVKRYLFVFF